MSNTWSDCGRAAPDAVGGEHAPEKQHCKSTGEPLARHKRDAQARRTSACSRQLRHQKERSSTRALHLTIAFDDGNEIKKSILRGGEK